MPQELDYLKYKCLCCLLVVVLCCYTYSLCFVRVTSNMNPSKAPAFSTARSADNGCSYSTMHACRLGNNLILWMRPNLVKCFLAAAVSNRASGTLVHLKNKIIWLKNCCFSKLNLLIFECFKEFRTQWIRLF